MSAKKGDVVFYGKYSGTEVELGGETYVIIRENEEDLYAGIEHRQTQDVVQCLKLVSRPGCERMIRYAFEFVLPTPEVLYEQRTKRSRRGTHPVDQNLSLPLIRDQVEVFRRTALYLVKHGVPLYIRPGTEAPPERILETTT